MTGWGLLAALALAACRDKDPEDTGVDPDAREACAQADDERQIFWGDLHVHTALSFDAWVYDVRLEPDDAYRFARGEAVTLASGESARLARPLDFAAVTDHSEYLGEIAACVTPGNDAYGGEFCAEYREANAASIQSIGTVLAASEPDRIEDICDEVDCLALAGGAWALVTEAAEDHYDRSSACEFTSFVGYEWTGATGVSNFHRNVIFEGARFPELPISYFEAPDPPALWEALTEQCLEADGARAGCDVLAIPHNSNMSNGRQFYPDYPSSEEEADAAATRAAMEPLLEIFQHKGDSECMNGLSGVLGDPDELCDFEKLRGTDEIDDCGDEPGYGAMANLGCMHQLDFARGILLEGLREEDRLGVNPYRVGLVASTDTHSGTPGLVEEADWPGHLGNQEGSPEARLTYPTLNPGGVINNPGGLAAVWAEENSRASLFGAMRRREVYGTSGPRIGVRFFGGSGLPSDLCERSDAVSAAYASGAPMGGVLDGDAAPSFWVNAWRDPEGSPLERVQIVKGWIDGDGQRNEAVFDVAGEAGAASVDPETCEVTDGGSDTLCAVWTDPNHDPAERAFYYARVLETPVCRWSTRDCNALPADERPESCEDPEIRDTLQERAWTSPIYSP